MKINAEKIIVNECADLLEKNYFRLIEELKNNRKVKTPYWTGSLIELDDLEIEEAITGMKNAFKRINKIKEFKL